MGATWCPLAGPCGAGATWHPLSPQVSAKALPQAKGKQFVSVTAKVAQVTLEKVLLVSPQSGHIFLQTDKPIYTPGTTGVFLGGCDPSLAPWGLGGTLGCWVPSAASWRAAVTSRCQSPSSHLGAVAWHLPWDPAPISGCPRATRPHLVPCVPSQCSAASSQWTTS